MADAGDLPAFDVARLIADVRAREPAAIKQAYEMTFGGPLGRLVLAHFLVECGVGVSKGDTKLKYAAGMHDAALMLADLARVDQAAIAVNVLSDTLEENTDGRRYNHDDDDGRGPGEFDDI